MSMFNQPADNASGGFFKPAEHNGHLILITIVHEIVRRFDTLKGAEIDMAVADVVDLDGAGELRERVNFTHTAIVSRLAPGATFVLGRIGQVATKSGFQAWALQPFNEGTDDAKAEAWVNAHKPTFTQAAPAAAAPAAVPAPVNTATGEVPSGVNLDDPAVRALLAQLQPATAAPQGTNPGF